MLTQNTVDYSDRCLLIKDTKQNFVNKAWACYQANRQQNTATEVSSLKPAELKNLTVYF